MRTRKGDPGDGRAIGEKRWDDQPRASGERETRETAEGQWAGSEVDAGRVGQKGER